MNRIRFGSKDFDKIFSKLENCIELVLDVFA